MFICRAGMSWELLFRPPLLLLQEGLQLIVLDRDALGGAFLIRGTRLCGRLLGELADIVAEDGDAVGDLRVGQQAEVTHVSWSPSKAAAFHDSGPPASISRRSSRRKRCMVSLHAPMRSRGSRRSGASPTAIGEKTRSSMRLSPNLLQREGLVQGFLLDRI